MREKQIPWVYNVDYQAAEKSNNTVKVLMHSSEDDLPQTPSACFTACEEWMDTLSEPQSSTPACFFYPGCGQATMCALVSSGAAALTYDGNDASSVSCITRGVLMNQPQAPASGTCAAPDSTCSPDVPAWSDSIGGCYFTGIPNMPHQGTCNCSTQQFVWQSVRHG